ncbi:hypothetical protein [Erythrobacter sp. F6033]|uniref:hypothetical protein n=1 Tax=Erythrobacter sp. F6033 TaxID=2926401 RepID=UPI001FF6A14F|nr:hypothetical protein [Erythrobacter sp. F6033]MCK0128900.1 hypothetical protein [Erythrobacter sp. F6033]
MRLTAILLAIVLLAVGGWYVFRDGGLLNQVTEERVEDALLLNGVPLPMAECMAPKLTERLSISQLTKLERLAPEEGEARVPRNFSEALKRLRRVDDDEAVQQLAVVGARCGSESLLNALPL